MTARTHAALSTVLLVVVLALLAAGVGSERFRHGVVDVAIVVAAGTTAVVLWTSAGRRAHGATMWRVGAWSFGLLFVGRVVHLVHEVGLQVPAFPGPADVFVLTASVLSVVSLAMAPGAPAGEARRTVVLDGGLVGVVGLLAFWVLAGSTWWAASPRPLFEATLAMAYPLLVSSCAVSVIVVFLVFHDHRYSRTTMGLMLGAMLLLALGTLAYGAALLADATFAGRHVTVLLTAGTLYIGTTCLTADPVATADQRAPRTRAPILLPYIAMLVGLVVTVFAIASGRGDLPTLAGAAVMLALLGSRNAITLYLHRELVDALNLSVAESVDELSRERARFRALSEHGTDLVAVVDVAGDVRWQSPAVERLLETEDAESLRALLVEGQVRVVERIMRDALAAGGEPVSAELRFARRDGDVLVVDMVAVDLTDDEAVGGVVMTGRDVTERHRLTDDLAWRAMHDPLTGLGNRSLLRARLVEAVGAADGAGRVHAVVVDLDGFKAVNDTLGHSAGDEVLTLVGRRLGGAVRDEDLVARLGGDEFIVLMHADAIADVERVADRVVRVLGAPYRLADGAEAFVRASVGVATTDDGTTADELLARADLAMYAAKERGGDRRVHFDPSMGDALQDRMTMAVRLRHAIEDGVLVHASDPVLDNLERLRRGGVRVAIDDFGTGYSSLASLDELPVDVLKIDRAFVARLTGGPEDANAIAAVVLRLGRSLGLDVVAEGVERPEQLAALRRLGCSAVQGWAVAYPASLDHWLAHPPAAVA